MEQQEIPQPGTITRDDQDYSSFEYSEPSIAKTFIDIFIVLARRKMFIVSTTLMLTSAAAVEVSFVRDSFRAEAVILPPQQQQSPLSAFASQAVGLTGSSGMASQLGLKDPADVYIGILKSRAVSEEIIAQFHLQELYHLKRISDTREALARHASFSKGKESFISISVEDHDPKRVAAMANAFVDDLYKRNSQLAITDASHRRLFFEEQLRKEKDALSEAETALKNTQQRTGLVVPSGQSDVLIRSAAQLRAEIASRQVALQIAHSYATDEHPHTQVLQLEISTMKGQLARIESDGVQPDRFEVAAGRLPEAGLEYIRKFRDVKYHETLYELIAKQYEAAVIDEARQAPLIQIIDRAETPDKKSGPHRAFSVFCFFLLGVALSSCYVFLVHHITEFRTDEANAESVAALRGAVRFGR
jgi:tyrosine-protein kinase Etk/Wzc